MAYALPHLRALLALGEWHSVSRAAVALGVSQPAVSKSLRALEREAGVPLVVKLPRGMRLTEAGEALFVHARTILSAVRAAEDDVAGFRGTARGTLRIAASTTIARYIVPQLLHDFLRRHPGVNVRLDSMHSRFVERLLLERQVDVALVETAVHHPRIRLIPWIEDRMVVVVGAKHPLARRARVAASALRSELLLVREPGSGAHAVAQAALREHDALPTRQLVMDDHEAIEQLLMLGTGIAVMPGWAVAENVRRGALRVLLIDRWDVRRSFFRLTLAGRRPSTVGRAFDALLDTSPGALALREVRGD
jgi:DNA-binding transcriptional LysR family regulator